MELLRNLTRRRSRTILTLLGVAIGIMALTLLGAISERFHLILRSSMSLWSERITVVSGQGSEGAGLILPEQIEALRSLPDVGRVRMTVSFPYRGSLGTIPGYTPQVSGVEPDALVTLPLQSGRHIASEELGSVVVGAALFDREGWRLGDEVLIEGRAFLLVGVVQPSLSVADDWLYLAIDDARELLIANTPWLRAIRAGGANSEANRLFNKLATSVEVFPEPGADAEALAKQIQRELPELTALSPLTMQSVMAERLQLINTLVLGSSIIGLLVGGVSVLNTMLMSTTERRAEFALKRALGATTKAILFEVLAESALIGLFGGLLGVGGGTILSMLLNRLGAAGYQQLFHLTGRLVLFALGFAVLVGTLAGLPPATRAARESPVDGLRHE